MRPFVAPSKWTEGHGRRSACPLPDDTAAPPRKANARLRSRLYHLDLSKRVSFKEKTAHTPAADRHCSPATHWCGSYLFRGYQRQFYQVLRSAPRRLVFRIPGLSSIGRLYCSWRPARLTNLMVTSGVYEHLCGDDGRTRVIRAKQSLTSGLAVPSLSPGRQRSAVSLPCERAA
jgi:hypothetical protein